MKGNKWAKETPVKLVLHSPPHIPHRDGFGNSIAYFTPLSPPCSREHSQGSGALQWRCPWCWIQLHLLHSHGAAAGWETLFFSDREQILLHRSKDNAIWKSLSRFCRLAGLTYALGVWCIKSLDFNVCRQLHALKLVSASDKMLILCCWHWEKSIRFC